MDFIGSGLRLLLRRLISRELGLRAVRHEDLLLITLEHSSGLPRLERGVLRELGRQIERLAGASEFVGAVITGSARAFCAGAELGDITSLVGGESLEFAREGQSVMERIERSAKPVIAAVAVTAWVEGLIWRWHAADALGAAMRCLRTAGRRWDWLRVGADAAVGAIDWRGRTTEIL